MVMVVSIVVLLCVQPLQMQIESHQLPPERNNSKTIKHAPPTFFLLRFRQEVGSSEFRPPSHSFPNLAGLFSVVKMVRSDFHCCRGSARCLASLLYRCPDWFVH